MSAIGQIARAPRTAVEFANVLLTTSEAPVGVTPRDVVWTHRKTTLYRYRSQSRERAIPVLLVFALINRPAIFDLRPGNSLVEFLLEQGFDVFLVDWGVPDEEDADMGLEDYVCDELHWALREMLRASAAEEATLMGWCMGGTLCAAYCASHPDAPVRNLVLLTPPIDSTGARYSNWVARDSFDAERIADGLPAIPGAMIDTANKLLKPVTNYVTPYRRLWRDLSEGKPVRTNYQAMARWVAANPPFPARAFRDWITWIYKENRLVSGTLRLRGRRVDLARIEQNLLVVTAGADHIAPREGALPILELAGSADITHFDRPGGHIGLMAGSKAREQLWPDLADWLVERSDR